MVDVMLERFEYIYLQFPGATVVELQTLMAQLHLLEFPIDVLPAAYLSLLSESNGGGFMCGEREYQLFSTTEVIQNYAGYRFATYMPFALPFALDGCGNFYLFDLRNGNDERIYYTAAGNMGWQGDEVFFIADNFVELLKQKIPLWG